MECGLHGWLGLAWLDLDWSFGRVLYMESRRYDFNLHVSLLIRLDDCETLY